MKVTLDVGSLQPQLSGIGRYTWELSRGLRNHSAITRLDLYARGRLINDPQALLENRHRPRPRLIRKAAGWMDRWKMRGGIFHGPNYFLPTFIQRGIVTVHDLSVLKFPETHPATRIAEFERRLGFSVERAAHIITDTEVVRQEVISMLAVPAQRVTAIPLGVDDKFRRHNASELKVPLSAYGLKPQGYGLCVSTLEPRKKISELIKAWSLLPAALRERFPLALAGGGGWRNDDLKEEIGKAAAQGWLKPLGFVAEGDLPLLYAGAALFIYPSSYEGFGLPPLEAMASGTPTIVADRSCLPEVCGEAAMYVNPDHISGFALKLEQALEDENLRFLLTGAGLKRAAAYTWPRCVDQTVNVYAKAASA